MVTSDRIAVMNQGRVEQLGPPVEVYERPATAFVAGFIGRTNLLRGTVKADGLVDCAGGVRLHAAESTGYQAGEQVAVSIRPHTIRLAPAGDAAARDADAVAGSAVNALTGTVTRAIYFGDAMDYQVAVGGTDCVLRVTGDPARRVAVGSAVVVRIPADRCILVR
jgi:ABC-type Fe3+/spermidine/putrescine transport system ATPase subunit